ncbi:MAG: 4-hydroxyphenylpyruvate dioxygenase, partial [Cyanobacteria bacterium P01_G01_bin.49]
PNSQIQEFLDINNGSGIQHIALKTNNITSVTRQLRSRGLAFLRVPHNYYTLDKKQLNCHFSQMEWQDLIEQNILLDSEKSQLLSLYKNPKFIPILLQIFTEPIFNKPTFFFEIIERREQAKGFGEGNFLALFKAIEREQMKRGTLMNC